MKIRILILCIITSACATNTYTQSLKIKGYDSSLEKLHLEHELDEISGLVYDDSSSTFLCVNDEEGILYRLDTTNFKIAKAIKFGKKGDYEGIAINGSNVYVINSKGDLWHIKMPGVETKKYKCPELYLSVEFESALYNSQDSLIYLISKQSSLDKENKATYIFAFDTKKMKFLEKPLYWFYWSDVNLLLKDDYIKSLHISDGTIDPLTKKIYLVASIERLMIVLDENWKVDAVYPLDAKMFKQPEGIAFDSKGDIYISNEAREGRPNIIHIRKKE